MYISMDGFNKMALAAAAAQVIDINKQGSKLEKDPQLKYKLGGHTACTLAVMVCSIFMYYEKPDSDSVITVDTLLATLSLVAIANFLLSALNTIAEFMKSERPYYDRLVNRVLNSARNIMGTLTLILGAMVFGLQSEAASVSLFIFACLIRMLDCVLDVGGVGYEIQCPDDTDKVRGSKRGGKMLVATFVFLAIGSAIGGLLWHIIDTGMSWEEPGDEILLLLAFCGLGLHELLLIVTLAFQWKSVQEGCIGKLGKKGSSCDDASVHSLNEIPIISAAVFTFNLLAVSMTVGVRLGDDMSVNLLAAMIAIIAIGEIAGRRMV